MVVLLVLGIGCATLPAPSEAGTTKYQGRHGPAKSKKKKTTKAAKPPPDRYGSIVIDAQSGYVLSEKNPDKKLFPASLTKMMTLYLAFEAIEKGALTKYQRLPVSANAQYQPPSKLGLEAGYSIRLEDAILALVTKSANDVAVVVGEGVGGSEARFARLMTFKAQQLGMRNTRFANASGLHDPEQYSSPRDMAILAQAIMRDFPKYYRYFSTPSFTYNGHTALNHNKLMATYPGMDGMKTGYVYASGYNLVASAVQNNHRLIGVVFGGRTSASRNSTMRELLDTGFERMKDPRVLAAIEQRLAAARGTKPVRKPAVPTAQAEPVRVAPRTARTQANLEAPSRSPVGIASEEGDIEETAAPRPQPKPMPAGAAPRAAFTAGMRPQPTPAANMNSFAAGAVAKPLTAQPPQTPAVPTQVASAASGSWAVQIGAFSDQNAGMNALRQAHQKLPAALTGKTRYIIAPLQTNRGVIYRARLSGFEQGEANNACKLLQGACLVMALQ
ncbi:MAG TPA: serine hydrolase [Patescibacteria group bacterium]|nr:serine hydrolase [Patescibacteria group bacterium]